MERPDRAVTQWRKSTYSGSNGSNCVEVTTANRTVLVRDTKDHVGVSLPFRASAWHHLTTTLKTTYQA